MSPTFFQAVFFAGLGALLFWLIHALILGGTRNSLEKSLLESQKSVTDQVNLLSRHLSDQLSRHNQVLLQNQAGYLDTVGHLHHRMGELKTSTDALAALGKEISSLQEILGAPKLRGTWGEFLLEELLRQGLPPEHFKMQHSFQCGSIVDAVILWSGGLISVDAKFPLENFRRLLQDPGTDDLSAKALKGLASDVKKHIDSIAMKYILPAEGTYDFAIMYVPAENVYYHITCGRTGEFSEITRYAFERHIMIASPSTFHAYLEALARGLKGQKIERSARQILQGLNQMETDLEKCFLDFEKMGTHLHHAVNTHKQAEKRLEKFRHDLTSMGQITETADLPAALPAAAAVS